MKHLIGKTFQLVKVTQAGNIFAVDRITLLLKPVNRTYNDKTKKPLYYLSEIKNGTSSYLSGLFATDNETVFSGDYKDGLGMKHIVHIRFSDVGKRFSVVAI